jgi:hypothetical protein
MARFAGAVSWPGEAGLACSAALLGHAVPARAQDADLGRKVEALEKRVEAQS